MLNFGWEMKFTNWKNICFEINFRELSALHVEQLGVLVLCIIGSGKMRLWSFIPESIRCDMEVLEVE